MTERHCKDPECGATLWTNEDESSDTPGYCFRCGEFVWAFEPGSQPDEWHIIPDYSVGDAIDGDQCGSCGGSFYLVGQTSHGVPTIVCTGGNYACLDYHEGCGDPKAVRRMAAHLVIF